VEVNTLARLHEQALASGGGLIGADLVDEDGQRDAAARRRDPDFVAMLRNPARMRLGVAIDEAAVLQRVDAVSGALMLLSRTLFERVGGFDAGYRLHAEDLDLCRRVRAAGATVACANDVRVLHVRGVSSRSRPLFVEWHKHRGLWRYYRMHAASGDAWPLRAAVFAAIWARFPWALLNALMRMRRR
jgi:GT2 family glycosyltransferase